EPVDGAPSTSGAGPEDPGQAQHERSQGGAMVDYEAYIADFLTGDDDALAEPWAAQDCAMARGRRPCAGRGGMRRFRAWAHDGVRECPRIVSDVREGRDLFAELDMDFHATKERPHFPFQHLFPGDSITVKFLAHYILNEAGQVWRL